MSNLGAQNLRCPVKEETIYVLLGTPVDPDRQREVGLLKFIPVPDSRQILCDQCCRPTWIGPRQYQRKCASPSTLFLCAVCLKPYLLEVKASGDGIDVASLGGKSATFYMIDGKIFAPNSPKN